MRPIIHFLQFMGWIVSLLFFYMDGFSIKYFTKIDMALNTEKIIYII